MIDIETNDFAPSSASSTDRAVVAQKNSKQILLEIEHVGYIIFYKYLCTVFIKYKMYYSSDVCTTTENRTNILCNKKQSTSSAYCTTIY